METRLVKGRRTRLIQLSLVLGLVVLAFYSISLFIGWCTGDTSKSGVPVVIESGLQTAVSCQIQARGTPLTACMAPAAPGLAAWVANQTCTTHGFCDACRKVPELDLSNATIRCITAPASTFNLTCLNVAYELDCDCP